MAAEHERFSFLRGADIAHLASADFRPAARFYVDCLGVLHDAIEQRWSTIRTNVDVNAASTRALLREVASESAASELAPTAEALRRDSLLIAFATTF